MNTRMLFVTEICENITALRVRNTEVSLIGIRYTSGRRGNVWSAGLAFSDSPLLYTDEKG